MGGAERLPSGRRVARHRGDGRDHRRAADCGAVESGVRRPVHQRLSPRAVRRGRHRSRRSGDRRCAGAEDPPSRACSGRREPGRVTQISPPLRLPAAERRQALVETALRVFSEGSYRGTTTAEIARAARVSEPILYRHFASKRDLYFACIDEAWKRLRMLWEETIASEPDPANWMQIMAKSYICLRDAKSGVVVSDLWMQAVVEAGDDAEVRKFLKRHMREVHDYMAEVIRRVQAAGVINAARDADAEAWISLAGGLLGTIGRRVGLLKDSDFESIRASRREWMTGSA
ncbi:MAG: TetR/AcrR family transcriptional regulator [Actinobacteria bacterium]|nr:MAG: TetR/AcrR family transcriptional regulator [Actinomycetota bacterium]